MKHQGVDFQPGKVMQICLLFSTEFSGFDLSPLMVVKSLGLILSIQSIFRAMASEMNWEQTVHLLLLLSFSVHLSLRLGPESTAEMVYTLIIPPLPAIRLCSLLLGSTGEAADLSCPGVLSSKNIDHRSSFLLQLNFDKAVAKAQEEFPIQPVFMAPLELSPPPCYTYAPFKNVLLPLHLSAISASFNIAVGNAPFRDHVVTLNFCMLQGMAK